MTKPLRLAFMGSPDFAIPVLEALVEAGHEIVCVYSQPPRRAGRGKQLRPTPVQAWADANGFQTRTPTSLKGAEEQAEFAALDLDAAVVVAYGLILPQAILDAPELGCMNMHASLLPRWRGAAPIQRAIMAGDEMTGVEAMVMEAGLDTGPVLATERTRIFPFDTAGSLHDRLAGLAADLAVKALEAWAAGNLQPVPQAETGITYAHKLTAGDQRLDWQDSPQQLDWQIRGLSPFPGAWFEYTPPGAASPLRIKALESRFESGDAPLAEPGTLIDDTLGVACGGSGVLRLTRLQKPGAKPMDAADFLRGLALRAGTRFS